MGGGNWGGNLFPPERLEVLFCFPGSGYDLSQMPFVDIFVDAAEEGELHIGTAIADGEVTIRWRWI